MASSLLLGVAGRLGKLLASGGGMRAPMAAGLAALALEGKGHLVAILPTETEARLVYDDLRQIAGEDVLFYLPPWDTLPFERVTPSVETTGERLRALQALRSQEGSGAIVVASARAVLMRLPATAFDYRPLALERGGRYRLSEVVETLSSWGYVREPQVGAPGEFSLRGSILDIYPPDTGSPVRADFFDDELDRLAAFDPTTQLSGDPILRISLLPAREIRLDGELREAYRRLAGRSPALGDRIEAMLQGSASDPAEALYPLAVAADAPILTDLLGPADTVVASAMESLRLAAERVRADEEALVRALAPTWGVEGDEIAAGLIAPVERITKTPARMIETGGGDVAIDRIRLDYRDFEGAVATIGQLVTQGYRVILTVQAPGRLRSLRDALAAHERYGSVLEGSSALPDAAGLYFLPGVGLGSSFGVPGLRVAVIADADLIRPMAAPHSHRRSARRADALQSFDAVAPGSYVVHESYGVAIYRGLARKAVAGVERDYLHLGFGGGDSLFLPSEQIGKLTLYVGSEEPNPTRLSGGEWQRQVAKARRAASEVAQELVVLYQKRLVTEGHPMGEDTPWQEEMEGAFPYELTPDQASSIAAVKGDLERVEPMDRMICGDVGFGKTEVAIRAAFKVIQSGYQVAVLAPTTLLAAQHFETFSDRFGGYPITVGMLSRFNAGKQGKAVSAGLLDGSVDCVVATHALLGREVRFKRLGLLVIDEEQRFGVSQKERIKQLYPDVDILTLSATPIPRTLELSLVGIRDLSLLRTPPLDRQPILTHVGPDDEAAVEEAIRRELVRGGQVFYVHNRVKDIDRVAGRVQALVPGARVLVAHGQMRESELERVVQEFWHRKGDVLVSTTIIENGIDLPSVNTLIVDHADKLGLAQLHQLRGRVGRSGQRAYAYLFYPPGTPIPEAAAERLRTIADNTDLGAGYRIAMRDLELRGAGTILGQRQSGHMSAVGYELYVKLVQEAIGSMTGPAVSEIPEIVIDLPVSYSIPEGYVSEEASRMDLYRRLATVAAQSEVEAIASELADRFGAPPIEVASLLDMARLRAELLTAGIRHVAARRSPKTGKIEVTVAPISLSASRELRLRRLVGSRFQGDQLSLPLQRGGDPISTVREALVALGVVAGPAAK